MKIYTKNKGRYEDYVHVWSDFLPNQQWFVEVRNCVSRVGTEDMDILTDKGKQTVEQELRAVDIFKQHNPALAYMHTPKDKPAIVDAVITKDDEITALVETKCRNVTYEDFLEHPFNNEWLITKSKVDSAISVARALCAPLRGFLYLVPSDILIVVKITDSRGRPIADKRVETTRTQKTVNGGSIERENYFIDMSEARIYTPIK